MMRQATERRVAYLRRGATSQIVGALPYRFRNFRLVFSATVPAHGANDAEAQRAAASYRELCTRTFQSFWMFDHPMAPADLIAWGAEILNPVQAWPARCRRRATTGWSPFATRCCCPARACRCAATGCCAGEAAAQVALRALTVSRFPDEPTLATMARSSAIRCSA